MRAPLLLFGFVFFLEICFIKAEVSCDTDTNPCQNGGICKDSDNNISCECRKPYTGKFCNKVSCDANPCENGGDCVPSGKTVICLCKEPYNGTFCTKSPCIPNPCENGGNCTIREDLLEATCSCTPEFTGEKCETQIDLCSQIQCQNEGECFIAESKAKCKCKEPFEGENCEIGPCSPNPCKNFGSCKSDGFTFKCSCIQGYKGSICEQDSNENPTSTKATVSYISTPSSERSLSSIGLQSTHSSSEYTTASSLDPSKNITSTVTDITDKSTRSSTNMSEIPNTLSTTVFPSTDHEITNTEAFSTESTQQTHSNTRDKDISMTTTRSTQKSTATFDNTSKSTKLSTLISTVSKTGTISTTGAIQTTPSPMIASVTSTAERISSEYSSSDYTLFTSSQDDVTDVKTISSTKRGEHAVTTAIASISTPSTTSEVSNSTTKGTDDSVEDVNESPSSTKATISYIGFAFTGLIVLVSLLASSWYIKRRCKKRKQQQYVDYASSEISINADGSDSII